MRRLRNHSRLIAWATLAAMLFSAVSPGLAATLLSGRAEVFTQMLGIPAAPPEHPDLASEHHHGHEAAPDPDSGSSPHDGTPHQTHGIYCSFCLNASATVALWSPPAAISVLTLAFHAEAVESDHAFTTAFLAHYRSRAPPFLS
jgi:hypothetical protein